MAYTIGMRLDKFLKVSRLIKRREVAKQLCDDSDVMLNGKIAKPSAEVNPGDELILMLGKHKVTVRVEEIKPYANKANAQECYTLIADEIVGGDQDA